MGLYAAVLNRTPQNREREREKREREREREGGGSEGGGGGRGLLTRELDRAVHFLIG